MNNVTIIMDLKITHTYNSDGITYAIGIGSIGKMAFVFLRESMDVQHSGGTFTAYRGIHSNALSIRDYCS